MAIWPTIPIIVLFFGVIGPSDDDTFMAVQPALEHPDRVSRLMLFVSESQLGQFAAMMQEPFPVLTHLSITSQSGIVSTLPDGFLGGSAPSLQQLDLCDILYPALPTLLLSTSNLVSLRLDNIPPTGYISPEAMVSRLATSPKLEILYIEFDKLASLRDLIISPPITRTILPSLLKFSYSGACKYLEDFVSRIDTPQLNSVEICYFWGWNINFDLPQLSTFIDRSEALKESLSRRCKVMVNEDEDLISFCVGRTNSDEAERWHPKPGILVCLADARDGQISHLANILGYIFPVLPDMVHCTIDYVQRPMSELESLSEEENRDGLDWLQLLHQLSSPRTLFVSDDIASVISQALTHVDNEIITELLPALQLLCLEGLKKEENLSMPSVHKFLAARQDSGHPITFVETKEEFEEKLGSYT